MRGVTRRAYVAAALLLASVAAAAQARFQIGRAHV